MDKQREKKMKIQPSTSTDQEVERQIAYVKAISDMEVEQLLSSLDLIRSQFTDEQQQIPLLQFFKENLPNISVVKNPDEHYELQWKEDNGNLNTDIHASLPHCMRMACPSCSNPRESFGGDQFSGKGNCTFQESRNSMMLMFPELEGIQTPGVSISSQRLSVGMTPKTRRLPKPGEMLLSVHGSPLGFCKEDNMEAINESEEG